MSNELHHYKCGVDRKSNKAEVDPITTQIVRNSLNSAAEQMKRALCRTAMSPVIYDVLVFAGAIYDSHMRLLAQAPSLPLFMGTLNFCIEEAVKGVGGESKLNEGDIIIYNSPYGTGSHPQDAALVMPVFFDGELIAYTAIKAHWLDIAGKEPYSTDTVDVFQEGPAPPKAKSFNSLGSIPCSIVISLIASAILALLIFRIPFAVSKADKLIFEPTEIRASSASFLFSCSPEASLPSPSIPK